MIFSRTKRTFEVKWNTFFLVSQVLSFRLEKQTSENVADTTFKARTKGIFLRGDLNLEGAWNFRGELGLLRIPWTTQKNYFLHVTWYRSIISWQFFLIWFPSSFASFSLLFNCVICFFVSYEQNKTDGAMT